MNRVVPLCRLSFRRRRCRLGSRRIAAVPPRQLGTAGLLARAVTWAGGRQPAPDTPITVRIRHRNAPVRARVSPLSTDAARVCFEDRGPAVTPGQAAVFYQADLVLGGGWIAEAIP